MKPISSMRLFATLLSLVVTVVYVSIAAPWLLSQNVLPARASHHASTSQGYPAIHLRVINNLPNHKLINVKITSGSDTGGTAQLFPSLPYQQSSPPVDVGYMLVSAIDSQFDVQATDTQTSQVVIAKTTIKQIYVGEGAWENIITDISPYTAINNYYTLVIANTHPVLIHDDNTVYQGSVKVRFYTLETIFYIHAVFNTPRCTLFHYVLECSLAPQGIYTFSAPSVVSASPDTTMSTNINNSPYARQPGTVPLNFWSSCKLAWIAFTYSLVLREK